MAVAEYEGPIYLRFGRPKVPNFTPADQQFEIGKAAVLKHGKDVTIIATGHLVWKAIESLQILKQKGIDAELINLHTIKPLDEEAVLTSIIKTRCVVTAEEHQLYGGLGESIAGLLSRKFPLPIEMVAVKNVFGQSGTPEQLMKAYGLDTEDIVASSEKVIGRK